MKLFFLKILVTGLLFAVISNSALAVEAVSLDALLQQIKEGRKSDAKENAERIEQFKADKAQQQAKLNAIIAKKNGMEARSKELETLFEENEVKIKEQEEELKNRLGTLKELFGVIQQVSGDTRGKFETSLTQVQFPGRSEFLTDLAKKMGETNQLATVKDVEQLWFQMQQEMTESGKVVKFPAKVVQANGQEVEENVTRVGNFNITSNGRYLDYDSEKGKLFELVRQPKARYLSSVATHDASSQGFSPFGIDLTRGHLLSLLVESPNLIERIHQGGIVGYIIIGIGILALVIAIWRFLALLVSSAKVSKQMKNISQPANNALGRVLTAYHENTKVDTETLELKLGEAILKETPKFNRMLMFLKIIAVVAPLLGLLGTVVGMIVTFQAITLFGAGDPKLMAGGISQALVTTVLGLCVAIPTVLLHTFVASRAKRLSQIIEEQAAGMVAEHAEKNAMMAAV